MNSARAENNGLNPVLLQEPVDFTEMVEMEGLYDVNLGAERSWLCPGAS